MKGVLIIITSRELYMDFIEDVAIEISQSKHWRKRIFNSDYNKQLLISQNSILPLPEYIRNKILEYNLQFYASKVKDCNEEFDEGLTIFKFQSVEYEDIARVT